MKNIKLTLKVLLILVFGLSLNLAYAQTEDIKVEVTKKEKKITIRKVKEVKGEKIEWDTTLVMTDENKEEVEKYLQEHQILIYELEGEEGLEKHIKMVVEMTKDIKDMAKWHTKEHVYELRDGHKKLIEVAKGEYLHKIKEHKHQLMAHKLRLKEHKHLLKEHNQQLIELHKDGKAYAYFVKAGDSAVKIDINFDHDFDFDFDYDFDFDMENKFIVDVKVDGNGENHMIWVDKKGKHKNIIKHFTKKGNKKGNIIFFGDDAHSNFSFNMNVDSELTEADFALLKKAGVKIKTKELAVDRLRLTYEDDSFALVFKLATEGKATIKVVDSNGVVVFNDKVQYFPGTYHKSLALNNENAGSYLICIEQGGASFTSKIDLN